MITRVLCAAALVSVAIPASVSAETIDFDSFPGGGVVVDNADVSDQYLPLGV